MIDGNDFDHIITNCNTKSPPVVAMCLLVD